MVGFSFPLVPQPAKRRIIKITYITNTKDIAIFIAEANSISDAICISDINTPIPGAVRFYFMMIIFFKILFCSSIINLLVHDGI